MAKKLISKYKVHIKLIGRTRRKRRLKWGIRRLLKLQLGMRTNNESWGKIVKESIIEITHLKAVLRLLIGRRRKWKRKTKYRKLFGVKQGFKSFYTNVNDQKFKKFVNCSINSLTKPINKLSSLLENRLDCVLFRSFLVQSFSQARQLINHRFVLVNGSITKNYGAKLVSGDIVSLNIKKFDTHNYQSTILSRSIPNYLQIDFKNLNIIFLWDPMFKSCYHPIKFKYDKIFRYYYRR